MSLRRSITLTPAALAARRANARRSTGPRTDRGKARAALNALKHGRYATGLPESLARAGRPEAEARWKAIRARIARVFEPALQAGYGNERGRRYSEKRSEQMANWVWCAHQAWGGQFGTKRENPLGSEANKTELAQPSLNCARIVIRHPWARLGLVFYSQRRRGWYQRKLTALLLNEMRAASLHPEGLGFRVLPEPGPEMEAGLRSKVYGLGRPRYWERIRHCLDREGQYHPEWREKCRLERQELLDAGMAAWLEPHPILVFLRQREREEQTGSGGPSPGNFP